MVITREQVADLHEGDVVEVSGHPMQNGATTRGPLYLTSGELWVGQTLVRYPNGSVNHTYSHRMTLAVISRAPRPFYTNHPRRKPVRGDVADSPDHIAGVGPWLFVDGGDDLDPDDRGWWSPWGKTVIPLGPGRYRLLVDGETGQVVP